MSSPFSVRRAAIAVIALLALVGTAMLIPSSSSASPARTAAPSAPTVEAPVLSGTPLAETSDGRSDSPRNLRAGCRMPRCFGSIAVNTRTGFWGKTKNYGSKRRAKRKAMRLCKSADQMDRYCRNMGWVRGRACLGAAKRVKGGEIRAVASAVRKGKRKSIRAAKRKLPGKARYKRKITATCNG